MRGEPKYRFVFDKNIRGTVYPHYIRDNGGIVATFLPPLYWDGRQSRYDAEIKELFRIAETVLMALNGATPPGTEVVPEGKSEPRMSLHEAEQYVDEFERAVGNFFRSGSRKNLQIVSDIKAKLILALTRRCQQ